MQKLVATWEAITLQLDKIGAWLPQLGLRLLLAWEYWESGVVKFSGNNWFAQIKDDFPFPFSVIPVEISWFLATWLELIGSLMLLAGLFTRFWALTLITLTIVAAAAVHWPDSYSGLSELLKGYAITDKGFGNYKLPVIYLIMLIPLLFSGAGKASVDHWLKQYIAKR